MKLSRCFRWELPFMRKCFLSYFWVKLGFRSKISQQDLFAAVLAKQIMLLLISFGIISLCVLIMLLFIIQLRQYSVALKIKFHICILNHTKICLFQEVELIKLLRVEFDIIMESDHQKKLVIHQILNQHGFYRLPLQKLLQILRLLEMPEAKQAKRIQDNTFIGLIKLVGKLQYQTKSKKKKYFTDATSQTASIEVKNYVMMIVEELLQSLNSRKKVNTSAPKKPHNTPLYASMMPINSMGYPSMDFSANASINTLQAQMMEERMKMQMQMQMYYMNMYSYGSHPQMSMSQAYPQSYEKVQMKQQPKPQETYFLQKKQEINQKESINQPQQIPQQLMLYQKQELIHQQKPQYIIEQKPKGIIEQKPQSVFEKKKNPQIEKKPIKTVQKKVTKKKKIKKKTYPLYQYQNPRPKKSKMPQLDKIPQQGMSMMKLVAQQVQIQTDLSLLNEEIQVFPRINQKLIELEKSHQKKKAKKEQTKKIKQTKEKDVVNQIIQQFQIIKQQQMQEEEEQQQKLAKADEKVNNEKANENVDDYIITVNRDYLREESFQEINHQPLPQLKSMSSQLLAFEKELKEELKGLKQQNSIQQNLKDCHCKGAKKKTQDCFDCLSCKRMFHSSCLHCPQYTHVQACHLCKMLLFDPINQVKEVIGVFYLPDIRRQKFQAEMKIAQYEYFLSKKIRDHQLQMRCFRLNDLQSNDLTWPDEVGVSVNNKLIVEIRGLDLKSSLKKRKDAAIVLTDFVTSQNRNSDSFSHLKIKIEMLNSPRQEYRHVNNAYSYAVGVYFIQKIVIQNFFEKFTQNLQNYTSDFIQGLMNVGDVDTGVEIQKVVCTLYDPFTRNLINTPVRGSKCQHGQCFDLGTYLALMYAIKNRQWKCPICSKQAKILYLDKDYAQLIKRSIHDKTIPNEITFMKDGRILLKISKNEEADDDETPPLIRQLRKKTKAIEKMKKPEQLKRIEEQKKEGQIQAQ